MTYIAKPRIDLPNQKTNEIGLTIRDYEGALSTLCAGCGHDSVTAAIVQSCFELSVPPHRVAKLSGIGCSSKTPAYFLNSSHGFNAVHGRMPAVATGANAAQNSIRINLLQKLIMGFPWRLDDFRSVKLRVIAVVFAACR